MPWISLRDNERGVQIGSGWNPHVASGDGCVRDVWRTRTSPRPQRCADDARRDWPSVGSYSFEAALNAHSQNCRTRTRRPHFVRRSESASSRSKLPILTPQHTHTGGVELFLLPQPPSFPGAALRLSRHMQGGRMRTGSSAGTRVVSRSHRSSRCSRACSSRHRRIKAAFAAS